MMLWGHGDMYNQLLYCNWLQTGLCRKDLVIMCCMLVLFISVFFDIVLVLYAMLVSSLHCNLLIMAHPLCLLHLCSVPSYKVKLFLDTFFTVTAFAIRDFIISGKVI